MNGRIILLEALKYKCLWQVLCQVDKKECPSKFFRNLHNQRFRVVFGQGYYKESQSTTLNEFDTYVPEDMIRSCVDNSFEVSNNYDADNQILREDKLVENNQNIKVHPALTINK